MDTPIPSSSEPSSVISSPRRRQKSPVPVALAALIGLLVVAGIVWLWMGTGDDGAGAVADAPTATVPEDSLPLAQRELPPLDLPELPASDAFIRDLVAGLSTQPQLARWLVTDDLIQRFVGVVVDLAGSSNPSSHVPFMIPEGTFTAVPTAEGPVIGPESWRRYNLISDTFVSLDTERSVELYLQIRPLVEEAYGQLGIPDYSFDDLLALAIQNVRDVQVPEEPMEVVGADGVYVFADPEVEARRGADKALLRMGPANARRIQEKMGDFARELGLTP